MEEGTCRICLESSPLSGPHATRDSDSLEDDQLISPCACTGTQAFVHFKCLRRWQISVMSSRLRGAGNAPALICSVCTTTFRVAPPKPAILRQLWKIANEYAWEVVSLLVILSACYLALTGHSLQSLIDELEGSLAFTCEVLPCAVRLNVWEKICLSPACSLLGGRDRPGHANLHPGTLLVATPAMPSPFFFGSVVVLYEHQRCSRSRGLILNMQLQEEKAREWEKEVLPHSQGRSRSKHSFSHGIGGPLAKEEWMILYKCATSQVPLEMCGVCEHEVEVDNTYCRTQMGQEVLPGLYLGQDISPLFEAERKGFPLSHQLLHGHAEWSVGQLESEIRRGLWVTKGNASRILLSTPPLELWHALFK